MKTHSLFLTLCLLILTTAHAFGQSRFGEETRLTDVIVKVQSGTLELPESRHEVPLREARINLPEITHVLTRYGATDILRSFPDANPADTLMFNEFGQPIRLINRSLVYRFRFPERTDLGRAAEDLSEIHEIVFASEIPEYQLDIIVQDPFFLL